jgi:hypothetical protein
LVATKKHVGFEWGQGKRIQKLSKHGSVEVFGFDAPFLGGILFCERDALPIKPRPQPFQQEELTNKFRGAKIVLLRGMLDGLQKRHPRAGEFRKVAENLYRYSSNGNCYARFRHGGKQIYKSLRTDDRELARRRLKEELEKAEKIDLKLAKMSLEKLLELYAGRLSQYEFKTAATRRSILGIFKKTWRHGLAVPVPEISAGQLELWLSERRAKLRNSTINEYARFLRQLFELAVKLRVLAESPAAGIKGLLVETPIRLTPAWPQFQAIVQEIRRQKLSADSEDSASLVEFMGRAGGGTAECANIRGEPVDRAGSRIPLCGWGPQRAPPAWPSRTRRARSPAALIRPVSRPVRRLTLRSHHGRHGSGRRWSKPSSSWGAEHRPRSPLPGSTLPCSVV